MSAPAPTKKRKRRSKALSRHKSSGSSKSCSTSSIRASLRRSRSPALELETCPAVLSKDKIIKSLRNKKDYLKRKNAKEVAKVAAVKAEVEDVKNCNESLALVNAKQEESIQVMQSSLSRVNQRLSDRTQRWIDSRARWMDELQQVKKRAEQRVYALSKKHADELARSDELIATLKNKHSLHLQSQKKRAKKQLQEITKQHTQDMANVQSQNYHLQRQLTKTCVTYEDKITSIENEKK